MHHDTFSNYFMSFFKSKEDCPCHRDESNHQRFFFMKSRDMLMTSNDEQSSLQLQTLWKLLYSQYKISLFIEYYYFICRRKDFHDEGNNIAVNRYLLLDGMSMGKVTKGFSYSFNVFHMSHSSTEGGTGKISE